MRRKEKKKAFKKYILLPYSFNQLSNGLPHLVLFSDIGYRFHIVARQIDIIF